MKWIKFALLIFIAFAFVSCGRAPSSLLRQGQLPLYDFPLYVSEGAPGRIWKYDRDGSRALLVEGLSNPSGIATDRFNNLYVVEVDAARLIKVNTGSGSVTVVRTGLQSP